VRHRAANGEQEGAIRLCLACRTVCDPDLRRLASDGGDLGPLRETIACVAILSLIGERLDRHQPCPQALLEHAIECADQLPDDGSRCAAACRAAGQALSDLIEANYKNGY
jgi:hypothetical protein